MRLFLKRAVCPEGTAKPGAVADGLAFIAGAAQTHSLDRLAGASRAGKRFRQRVLDRFWGIGNHDFYAFKTKHGHLLCCTAILAGCATTELPKVTQVPVPVPCLEAKDAPTLPATKTKVELQALADEALVLTIAAERNDLIVYGAKADAVIRACR